jgi:hypothetical protein
MGFNSVFKGLITIIQHSIEYKLRTSQFSVCLLFIPHILPGSMFFLLSEKPHTSRDRTNIEN